MSIRSPARSLHVHSPCIFLGSLAISVALLAASPGLAEQEAADPQVPGAVASPEISASSGLRVYRDPTTGRLIELPTTEQEQELTEKLGYEPLQRSDLGLEPFLLQGGGRGVYLARRFHSALVVQRDGDGHFHLVCGGEATTHSPPLGIGAEEAPEPSSPRLEPVTPSTEGGSHLGWPVQ